MWSGRDYNSGYNKAGCHTNCDTEAPLCNYGATSSGLKSAHQWGGG